MTSVPRTVALALLVTLAHCHGTESPDSAVPNFLGGPVWTSPGWVKVRATAYPCGGKCASGPQCRYASAHLVGSASAPSWIPRGSLIRIWTSQGPLVYLAMDKGTAVESSRATRKSHDRNKAAVVIDFCAPRQLCPDQAKVEVYQYVAVIPFDKLTLDQKEQLMSYARRYISQQ